MLNTIQFIINHPLCRQSKAAALQRWISWQARSRFAKRALVEPFVEDAVLVVESGMTGATGNIYCGLHEVADMGFVLHALRPGDLFLDVGANIGSFSILASGGVGCGSIAIEPIPATFAKLRRNIGVNDLFGLVETHNVGAGSSPSSLRFTDGLDTVNHVLAEGERGSSIDVEVVVLDQLLGQRRPTVIKIDVEGFELEVLKGLQGILDSDSLQAVVMEVNGSGTRYGVSDQDICEFMTCRGFNMHTYDAINRDLIAPDGSGNVIFVRIGCDIRDRTKSAPRYRLNSGVI